MSKATDLRDAVLDDLNTCRRELMKETRPATTGQPEKWRQTINSLNTIFEAAQATVIQESFGN